MVWICLAGLLLVFGAFLAYETRKVTVPALNDSKFIGKLETNTLTSMWIHKLHLIKLIYIFIQYIKLCIMKPIYHKCGVNKNLLFIVEENDIIQNGLNWLGQYSQKGLARTFCGVCGVSAVKMTQWQPILILFFISLPSWHTII